MTALLSPSTRGHRATAPVVPSGGATWFDVREVAEATFVLAEPGHVNSFLLVGREQALLLDSGTGIGPIGAVVRGLTGLPVVVVNSHDHLDHRGGNADLVAGGVPLVDVCAHPAGRHDAVDPVFLRSYAEAMTAVVTAHRDFTRLDSSYFFALADLPPMRDLPDLADWSVPALAPTRRLVDGEEIDLGGRVLQVLHTPGHSADSLVLLEPATRTLFSGDTVLAAAHWLHGAGADLAAFAASTARLAALGVDRVLPAHNLRHWLPGSVVGAVAAAAEAVLTGASTPVPGRDLLGGTALRHEVGGVVLLTPVAEDLPC